MTDRPTVVTRTREELLAELVALLDDKAEWERLQGQCGSLEWGLSRRLAEVRWLLGE